MTLDFLDAESNEFTENVVLLIVKVLERSPSFDLEYDLKGKKLRQYNIIYKSAPSNVVRAAPARRFFTDI